ncbi:hypothetical protein [Dyella sp.]
MVGMWQPGSVVVRREPGLLPSLFGVAARGEGDHASTQVRTGVVAISR